MDYLEKLLDDLTGKLIEIAKFPNRRKEFTFSFGYRAGKSMTLYFYKNEPRVSNMEPFSLVAYYACLIKDEESEEKADELCKKAMELLKEINCEYDRALAEELLYRVVLEYIQARGNKESVESMINFCGAWLIANCWIGVTEEVLQTYLQLLRIHPENHQDIVSVVDDISAYVSNQMKLLSQENMSEEDVWNIYESIRTYILSKEDEIGSDKFYILGAFLQVYGGVEPPKKERIKKGSFDYNYGKAEKGDKECQRLVAQAYREGIGVRKNMRLANFWEGVSNGKYVE